MAQAVKHIPAVRKIVVFERTGGSVHMTEGRDVYAGDLLKKVACYASLFRPLYFLCFKSSLSFIVPDEALLLPSMDGQRGPDVHPVYFRLNG